MNFSDFALSSSIQANITAQGYETPTPIQEQAIPLVLSGVDVLGSAQTGSGKTAAFALPILQLLSASPAPADSVRPVRALILCPTRELAAQIGDSFRHYGKNLGIRFSVVFGGVNIKPQAASLRAGVDIVIATPGRLMDLHSQRMVKLDKVQMLVLDEADRMLDMGFIHDIRKIIAYIPKQRQTLFFSATMPKEIRQLSDSILTNPTHIQIAPDNTIASNIEESVYFVPKAHKPSFLAHLFHTLPMSRAIVFTRTKHGADRVVRCLAKYHIQAEALHANKSQNARKRALDNFKSLKSPMLVATDIASRGIDIDDISHVVNYDVTHEPETYVHRIGRTARAGASGSAICLCDTSDEIDNLKGIERLIKHRIPVKEAEGYVKPRTAPPPTPPRHPPHAPQRPNPNPPRRPDHFPVAKDESHFHDPVLDSINPSHHQPRKKFDPNNRPHRAKPYNKPRQDDEFGAVLNEISQLEDPSQHPLFDTEQEFPKTPEKRPHKPHYNRDDSRQDRPHRPHFKSDRPRFDREDSRPDRPGKFTSHSDRPGFNRDDSRSERPARKPHFGHDNASFERRDNTNKPRHAKPGGFNKFSSSIDPKNPHKRSFGGPKKNNSKHAWKTSAPSHQGKSKNRAW